MTSDQTNQSDRAYQEEGTLSDFFGQGFLFCRRRWKEILFCGLAGALLTILIVTQIDDRYKSSLLVLVEPPATNPLEDERSQSSILDGFVDSQVYIIESKEVLRDAVVLGNLTEEPFFQRKPESAISRFIGGIRGLLFSERVSTREQSLSNMSPEVAYALQTLNSNLKVEREGDTNLITIEVAADSGALAAKATSAVGEAFSENRRQAQFQRAERVAQWLDERVLLLQRQVSDAEDAVAKFQIEKNLISGSASATLGEQQLSEFNSELIRTKVALAERRASYRRALQVLEGGGDIATLPEIQENDIINALRTSLLDIERREAELERAGVENPRYRALREERLATQEQLNVEFQRIVSSMANEVEALEGRATLISDALSEAGGQTGAANISSVELRELQRKANAYRALYERYLNNAGLSDESTSYVANGVEIVDPATVPLHHFYPKSKLLLIFGTVLGMCVGAGAGYLRERLNPGFVTINQAARALDVPVIGSIPRLGRDEDPFRIARDETYEPFSEEVRSLRHALVGAVETPGAPVLLMTAAGANDGRTELSAALAASAIAAGKNVLLIDADLRDGQLTRYFDLEDDDGLTDILHSRSWSFSGMDEGEGVLDFVPIGQQLDSSTDTLTLESFEDYLEEARSYYDVIVIDSPSTATLDDVRILSRLSDVVGFSIRWNDTARDAVKAAINRLGHGLVTGLVLYGVDSRTVARYGETVETHRPVIHPPSRRAAGAPA